MSDTNITTRRVAQNRRTSKLAYAPISELPYGETSTDKQSVPASVTSSDPQYIKVDNQYYELKGKMPSADDLMFGEIAVAFPANYERLYIKNSSTDIVEFAPNVDFRLYNLSGTDADGNTITSLAVQNVGNHIRLGYTVGNSPRMGEIITSTDATPTSLEHTINVGNAYIFQTPLTEATFDISSLVGYEDATTQETNIYFQVDNSAVVIDLIETNTSETEHEAQIHFGNYTPIEHGVRYSGFIPSLWYVISIKDNCVICGPTVEEEVESHVLVVDNTGSSLSVTMNGSTISPRSANIDNIKSNKINAYPSDTTPVIGDVVIIREKITSTSGSITKTLSTAYEYTTSSSTDAAWPALSGNYSADDIILTEDITLAGNYTRVGNIELSSGTIAAKGMTLTQLLTQIFTLELKGSAATTPSVTFAAPTATSYEYGTIINSISYNKAVLNDGTYNYTNAQGSNAMGVTASAWAYNITTSYGSSSSASGSFTTSSSGTSPAAGTLSKGILISDESEAVTVGGTTYAIPTSSNVGTNATIFAKTIQLSAVATATVGNWAPTNLHNVPTTGDLAYKYTLTTANRTGNSGVISGYRNIFYGNTSSDIAQTSAAIRGLSNNVKSTTSSITIGVVSGTSRRYIAMPLGRKITAAVDNGTGYSVLSNYEEITTSVQVNGANECLSIAYRLYRCVAGTGSFNASHTLTIGNA